MTHCQKLFLCILSAATLVACSAPNQEKPAASSPEGSAGASATQPASQATTTGDRSGAANGPEAADDDSTTLHVSTRSGTIDCTGKNVEIVTDNAQLVLKGACGEIYIIGKNDSVDIDRAKLVQVSGGSNVQVKALGRIDEIYLVGDNGNHHFADVGELNVNSDSNQIDARSIETLSLSGSLNNVRWASGSPSINDIGRDNTLQPAK